MLGAAHETLDLTGWLWAERSSIVRAWEDQAGGPTDEAPDRKRVIEALARDLDGNDTEPALRPAEAAALREAIFTRLEAGGARCEVATLRRLDRAIDRRVLGWAHTPRGPPTPEAELPFRLLVDQVKDYAIFLLDPEGRVASWNRGAERIKGYRAEEILGEPLEWFYPPEEVAAGLPREALAFARRHGRHEVVGQRLRKDGGRFWAEVTITALYDETGNHLGYLKITRDITERREAEEERTRLLASEHEARERAEQRLAELRRSDARLRRIVDSNMIGIGFWRVDGAVYEANDALLGMLGFDRSDLASGRADWRRLTPAEYAAADAAALEAIRRHGSHPPLEKEFLHRDGHRVPVLIASASVPDEPEHRVSIVLDMQPLHAAERRVRESETRLQAILAYAPAAIYIKDRRGAYELVNPAWERATGRAAAEAIGRTELEVLGAAADSLENDRRVLEGAETLVDVEERVPREGREGIYRTIKFPLLSERGEVRAVVGISVDVTAARRAEEELAHQVQMIRSTLDNAQSGFLLLDASGRTTFANPEAFAVTGWSLEELQDRPLHEVIHHSRPDGTPYPLEDCPLHRVGRPLRPERFGEDVLIRKDGAFFPVEYGVTPVVRDGELVGWVFEFRDISFRKDALAALRRLEEELDRVFSASPDLLATLAFDGRVRRINPAFTALLGFPGEVLMRQPWTAVVHPDDGDAVRAELAKLARGEPSRTFLIRMLRADGGFRWVSWNAFAIPGGPLFVAAGRDVTDEKERAEFERELIGIVSHDLKNPLAAVKVGAATLLRRADELDEQTRRVVGRIAASAERSLALIRDLLDFTRARRGGGIPILPEPLDLDELVRRVVDDVHAIWPEREIRVHAAGAGRGRWDPARLAQVVDNLLVNALKYSPLGSTVQIETSGDENTVRLAVKNRGEPIPAAALPHIFEPLRRARRGGAPDGSVGLGLYIVDRIVRGHGGHVEARSSAADGTTFTVALPRWTAPTGQPWQFSAGSEVGMLEARIAAKK